MAFSGARQFVSVPVQIVSRVEELSGKLSVLSDSKLGMTSALATLMSKKSPFKKLIWAYDPFEGTVETHPGVVSALSALEGRIKVSIDPVYVLSPASISLQMSLSQPHTKQYVPSSEDAMRRSLKDVRLKGLGKPSVIVQKSEMLREAVKAFLAYAKSKRADLLVVGTHANKGLSRLLLGSFAETLILQSKIPVLVVNPAVEAKPIGRILFPSDLSPESKGIFKSVCTLAKQLGARLELLHVTPHPFGPLFQSGVFLIGGGWVPIPEFTRAARERAEEVAGRWKDEAASDGVEVSIFIDPGSDGVRHAILERAKNGMADLIAIEAKSGPVGAALIGSIVRQVLREAPCPVWVTRTSK